MLLRQQAGILLPNLSSSRLTFNIKKYVSEKKTNSETWQLAGCCCRVSPRPSFSLSDTRHEGRGPRCNQQRTVVTLHPRQRPYLKNLTHHTLTYREGCFPLLFYHYKTYAENPDYHTGPNFLHTDTDTLGETYIVTSFMSSKNTFNSSTITFKAAGS